MAAQKRQSEKRKEHSGNQGESKREGWGQSAGKPLALVGVGDGGRKLVAGLAGEEVRREWIPSSQQTWLEWKADRAIVKLKREIVFKRRSDSRMYILKGEDMGGCYRKEVHLNLPAFFFLWVVLLFLTTSPLVSNSWLFLLLHFPSSHSFPSSLLPSLSLPLLSSPPPLLRFLFSPPPNPLFGHTTQYMGLSSPTSDGTHVPRVLALNCQEVPHFEISDNLSIN